MKIQEAIDMLTRYTGEGGMFKPDDEIIINWWSYDDVLIQEDMSNEKARVIWSRVFDVLDRCDDIDNQFVRDEISTAIAEYDEANKGA